jgi:thymidylate synthase
MPLGEANRAARLLREMGVASAFPRPFCTLAEVGDEVIDEFARYFGAPLVEIESLEGKVKSMTVHRGAPCGSTEFVAERMEGVPLQEAVERAGLLHHHYPCLASMAREEDLGDTLMHISGHRLKQDVEREVRKRGERRANYLEP